MDGALLLTGLAVGLVFGVPVGVIGALALSRSVEHGFAAGLATGLGCSVADVFYACAGVLGLTVVSSFFHDYQALIGLVGGIAMFALGVAVALRHPRFTTEPAGVRRLASFFGSSFLVALSNPATLAAFLLAFSLFGVERPHEVGQGVSLVVGIFAGTLLWWVLLAGVASASRTRITEKTLRALNVVFGVGIAVVGVVAALSAFF